MWCAAVSGCVSVYSDFSDSLSNDWQTIYKDQTGLNETSMDQNAPDLGSRNLKDKMPRTNEKKWLINKNKNYLKIKIKERLIKIK